MGSDRGRPPPPRRLSVTSTSDETPVNMLDVSTKTTDRSNASSVTTDSHVPIDTPSQPSDGLPASTTVNPIAKSPSGASLSTENSNRPTWRTSSFHTRRGSEGVMYSPHGEISDILIDEKSHDIEKGLEKVMMTLVGFTTKFVCRENDSYDIRVQATLTFWVNTLVGICAGVWGIIYWTFGGPDTAIAAWFCLLMNVLALGILLKTRKHYYPAIIFTLGVWASPIGVHILLGGFAGAQGVLLWSIFAPLAAGVLLNSVLQMLFWSVLEMLSLVILAYFDHAISHVFEPHDTEHDWQIRFFYVMNLICPIGIILVSVLVFVYWVKEQKAIVRGLLENIVPKDAVPMLLASRGSPVAKFHKDVSVLFLDIVNFTTWCKSIETRSMVVMLRDLFQILDDIVEQFPGINKIKTIGDAYMVAGGVPQADDEHVEQLATAALLFQMAISEFPRGDGTFFQARIGLHVGPVTAGILGLQRLSYDLWGDTVNFAARLESRAPVGGVLCSSAIYKRLKRKFNFKKRDGQIYVKGFNAPKQTYLLYGSEGENIAPLVVDRTGIADKQAAETFSAIVEKFCDPVIGVKLSDVMTENGPVTVFAAKDAVDWMVRNRYSATREDAVEIGRLMSDSGLFAGFLTGALFSDDTATFQFSCGPSERLRPRVSWTRTDASSSATPARKGKIQPHPSLLHRPPAPSSLSRAIHLDNEFAVRPLTRTRSASVVLPSLSASSPFISPPSAAISPLTLTSPSPTSSNPDVT